MTLTPSTMLSLQSVAPDFDLPDTQGNTVSLKDFDTSKAVVVIFMCNHCPYVLHIKDKLIDVAAEYIHKGIAFVGISANDIRTHPADAPDKMAQFVQEHKLPFPYLYDESQEVAKAYKAACTPDIYVFDAQLKLVYRGQFDDSRPGNNSAVTGQDLTNALDAILAGAEVSSDQKPSLGCNIKWKLGNEPGYF